MSACIRSAYELRLKQLDNAVTGVGPLRFLKLAVDIDRDAPADQSERRNRRSSPGSFTATVEFPQIIDPDTPETAAWNKIFYRDAHSDEGMCAYSGEHYQSYEIKYASDRLISLAVSEYTYCWPAPRGEENRQVLNYYVGNEPRPLKAEDVFDETTPWADFISKKCLDLAKASGLFDDHDENAAWRAQVREKHIKHTVVDTGQWGISQNGLTIVAPFVISNFVTDGEAQDVTITWAELTPFLRKDFKAVGSPAH